MAELPPLKLQLIRWTLFALLVLGGLGVALWLGPVTPPVIRPGGALP